MKGRTTLILVGVFVALLAYVYLAEIRRPEATSVASTPTPPLLSVAADQVLGLTVHSGQLETRLSRQPGGAWQLEAPQPGPADESRVGQFLGRMASLYATRTLDEVGPLEDYGLAQPALEVTLALADGSSKVLSVGSANPQFTAYYAQVQGVAGVHLVPALLVQSAQEMLTTPPLPPTPEPSATPTPGA